MACRAGVRCVGDAGPGVSRGSPPGHFLETCWVGWKAGAAKDE
jgi:hypothetical protein